MRSAKALLVILAVELLALGLTGTQSAIAANEGVIGNGGGAWVCRETNGKIRWSKLVDLFEATDEFGLSLAQYSGSLHSISDQIQLRISRSAPDFDGVLAPYVKALNELAPNPPKVTYTDDILETIDDALCRLKPAPASCAGGEVAYEQLVNYKLDGLILVQSEIYKSLSDSSKVALLFHEAIYKYRRDTARDANSVVARRMVGLIFSTLSTADLKKELSGLGDLEADENGMRFVSLPSGSFMMGSPSDDVAEGDNQAQHLITLVHPFDIQAADVTQAQYFQVMGVNPSIFQKRENCPKTFQVVQNVPMCPDNPVENVSWSDVQAFISKLNATSGPHQFRLPTEEEWEYATRAGTATVYSFGNDPFVLSDYGWFSGNSGLQTREVALLKPNAFGLYDMQGNVWQWVSSADDGNLNPPGPLGPSRIVRGGGWGNIAKFLRSDSRFLHAGNCGSSDIGFRLVRT